jgi:hypothetical protein
MIEVLKEIRNVTIKSFVALCEADEECQQQTKTSTERDFGALATQRKKHPSPVSG